MKTKLIFYLFLLFSFLPHGSPSSSPSPVNIGVILDLQSSTGKSRLTAIKSAISDCQSKNQSSPVQLVLHVRDSGGDVVTATSQALKLIKSTKVKAILGPQTAEESIYFSTHLTKQQIPILSLSATSPFPANTSISPYFLPSPATSASSAAATAAFISAHGWKSTVLILSSPSLSVTSLVSSLSDRNIHVALILTVNSDPTPADIDRLRTTPIRVYVVDVAPTVASPLFSRLRSSGFLAKTYTWILISDLACAIGSSDPDPNLLQGFIAIRPKTHCELYAYKSAYAIATSSDLGSIAQSPLVHVEEFEAVNLVGNSARSVGKWTADTGFVLTAGIVWPGEAVEVPKGWEKVLRIGVPGHVEPGFRSFLWIERDNATGQVTTSGFVMDVFAAAVEELEFRFVYEFVAFADAQGRTAGDYNDLVRQVYLKKYDAVVGDVTITSNRTAYVDFTQPYTVSGVSMVVPIRNNQRQNTWIFLKPLTTDLWVVSLAFFVFTGAVVWLLEHRINEEFRGPPANQLGTVFYFSFSTMVFAQKNVVSNLSRFVVIVWVFVVLILTSSYTASLTSMLTVQQLQPAVTDMGDLIKNGEYVGYLADSFVKQLLLSLGFNKSKLRPYRSPQQYAEALSKGSNNGGVSAIVDEIPYLRVFLKDYCGNYTMAGPTYKTGGFGFAFTKGSPLASDISTAILKVTESYKMREIEHRWFGDQNSCSTIDTSSLSSNGSLSFSSFWGLFLITGSASAISLFLFAVSFLYEHRHVLTQNTSESNNISFWGRISSIAKTFDERDHSFHTFRTESMTGSVAREGVHSARVNDVEEVGTSPSTPTNFVSGR